MGNTAKMYCQVFGVVLVAVGLLDIVFPGLFGLFDEQTWLTRTAHTLGGTYIAYIGFSGSEGSQIKTAQVLGIIGLIAAILGFLAPSILEAISVTNGTNFNIVYAIIGLAGVFAGWMRVAKQTA